MEWEAIGAVGEIAGAVAVILTLVYLSAQIRESNSSSRAQTRALVTDQILNILGRVLEQPGRLETYRCSMRNEELTDAEESEYEAQREIWERRFRNERVWQSEWEIQREFHSPDFRTLIDSYIASDRSLELAGIAHFPLAFQHLRSRARSHLVRCAMD